MELEFLESEDWLWKASLTLGRNGRRGLLGKVTTPGGAKISIRTKVASWGSERRGV